MGSKALGEIAMKPKHGMSEISKFSMTKMNIRDYSWR